MKKHLIIVLFFLILCPDTKGQFNNIESFGAKAVGNGSCITLFRDISSIYGNVAGISNINNLAADISYENRFQAFNLSNLGFGLVKNFSKAGSFGVTIKKFGIEEYSEFQAGINYARKLTDAFSIGIRFNMYNLVIEEYGNRTGYNADFGLQYELNEQFSLAFYLVNPFPVKFIDDVRLPVLAFMGLKYNVSESLGLYAEIEKHFDRNFFIKAGLQFDLMKKLSLYGGFRNDLDRFSDFSVGIQYSIAPMIQLNICSQYNTSFGLSPALGISYVNSNK
ncbi:MAG: hypothetical protein ACM3PT_01565 [Deltaproteobacteria bacterium]